jgi:carbon-monoxide dehydrogenase medium subunit
MIPGEFDYYAPATLNEAVSLLQQHNDAKILAGGQSLIPAMRFRLSIPEILIDLNTVDGLQTIRESDGRVSIGAMTCETELEEWAAGRPEYAMLHDASLTIADPIVRNRATVGGNLAHADPANDHPAVMLAYAAELVALGPNGTRTIAIDDFFVDLFENSLDPGEILTEIRIPTPQPGSGGAYVKVERKVGDFATSAVAVQLTMDGDACTAARIATTNVNPTPIRSLDAERQLIGNILSEDVIEAAGQAAAAECDPSPDLRGSVAYKRDLTRVLTKRAIRKAVERASSNP